MSERIFMSETEERLAAQGGAALRERLIAQLDARLDALECRKSAGLSLLDHARIPMVQEGLATARRLLEAMPVSHEPEC